MVGRPWHHPVIDLPESLTVTTEYHMLKVQCSECGAQTRAELPAGVESGAFGPRLRATIVMLAAMLLSRRAIALVLADVLTPGSRLARSRRSSRRRAALAGPWEAIKRAV